MANLAPIQWRPALITGVEEIDRAHRRLVTLVNRVAEQLEAGQERDIVGALLDDLDRTTETHFADEERLMDAHSYPLAEAHKSEHRLILDDLRRHSDAYVLGHGAAGDVVRCLEHWFESHIIIADQHLGAALSRR